MADETTVVDWKAGLSADLKAVVDAKGWKNPGEMAKSYHELEGTLGNSIRIPGPDASEADRKAFQDKLQKTAKDLVEVPAEDDKAVAALRGVGRLPKEAKEYAIPEDAGLSKEEGEALQAEAYDLGMTRAAFGKLVKKFTGSKKAQSDALKANERELRSVFGDAFDDEIKGLRILAEQTGAPEDVKKAIEGKSITKGQVEWLKALGKRLGLNTREVASQGPGGTQRLTVAEAKARDMESLRKANDMKLSQEERGEAWRNHVALQAVINPELAG